MKTIRLNSRRGFSLLEAVVVIGIMGIVISGLGYLLQNGFYMWNFGSARMAVNSEARIAIEALHKFVQNAQSSTIRISRKDASQPANSFIAGKLAETIYLKTTGGTCGFAGGGSNMVGTAGAEFQIFQDGKHLVAYVPVPPAPGAYSSPSTITVSYNAVTITSNLEAFTVSFTDTTNDKIISVGVRLSKRVYHDRPPISIMLKKAVVLKHHHTSGFYGN
ncbi:MAG TPA: type II secretion system protein [bacterium]|nr:type II secretion system protein [bacterium]